MSKDKQYCNICGREDKLKNGMCKRHYQEMQEFGFTITDAQDIDPNEIILHNDYAELIIKDTKTEYEQARIKIDIEDIDTISQNVWHKGIEAIISKDINGNTIMLKQSIMDNFEDNIKNINGDNLDCRKENLEVITKVKKQRRQPIVSKKNKNKIIIEFIGESHKGVVGSGILISYPVKNGGYEKILIELGMYQANGRLKEEYVINKGVLERVPSEELVACFISHSHA